MKFSLKSFLRSCGLISLFLLAQTTNSLAEEVKQIEKCVKGKDQLIAKTSDACKKLGGKWQVIKAVSGTQAMPVDPLEKKNQRPPDPLEKNNMPLEQKK